VLDPNQARARQSLRHARTLLPAWVSKPEPKGILEGFFIRRHHLNPTEQAAIAALTFLLAALLFAAAIYRHSPLARNLAFLLLPAWLGLLFSATIQDRAGGTTQAVLIADETIAHAADSPNAPMRFAQPLPAGTKSKSANHAPIRSTSSSPTTAMPGRSVGVHCGRKSGCGRWISGHQQ